MIIRGVVLDLVLGDPAWFPHPVRGIGWLIEKSEILWRSSNLPLRLAGTLTWITVAGITVLVVRSTPKLNVLWIWSFLAVRSLDRECAAVVRSMSRDKLALIVGRDTGYLSDAEVLRAVLETMSENLSDGVVAPLFYLALGGPPAMAAYKAANTMDSMLGYKNSRYREFGWFAAKADDVANWLPARLTAACVWVAAAILGMDWRRSVRVTLRDGATQPSPNAGFPEAAFAGALGVQLGGTNYYGGVPSRKATLGDAVSPLSVQSFQAARKLLYLTSAIVIGAVLCWRR